MLPATPVGGALAVLEGAFGSGRGVLPVEGVLPVDGVLPVEGVLPVDSVLLPDSVEPSSRSLVV